MPTRVGQDHTEVRSRVPVYAGKNHPHYFERYMEVQRMKHCLEGACFRKLDA